MKVNKIIEFEGKRIRAGVYVNKKNRKYLYFVKWTLINYDLPEYKFIDDFEEKRTGSFKKAIKRLNQMTECDMDSEITFNKN